MLKGSQSVDNHCVTQLRRRCTTYQQRTTQRQHERTNEINIRYNQSINQEFLKWPK